MNRKPARGGPHPFELFFEPDEIDQICEQALRSRGLFPSEPRPVRIDKFVEDHFPSCITDFDDFGAGILGGVAFRPDGELERLWVSRTLAEDPSQVAQRRVRSTFAHEAGHGMLHGCLFVDDGQMDLLATSTQEARRILCRAEDIAPTVELHHARGWWEVQANRAIGGLLLPKELVRMAVQPFAQAATPFGGLILVESRRESAVREVAECFEVSAAVARIRLQKMFAPNGVPMLQ